VLRLEADQQHLVGVTEVVAGQGEILVLVRVQCVDAGLGRAAATAIGGCREHGKRVADAFDHLLNKSMESAFSAGGVYLARIVSNKGGKSEIIAESKITFLP
jgi:hypothetical protein